MHSKLSFVSSSSRVRCLTCEIGADVGGVASAAGGAGGRGEGSDASVPSVADGGCVALAGRLPSPASDCALSSSEIVLPFPGTKVLLFTVAEYCQARSAVGTAPVLPFRPVSLTWTSASVHGGNPATLDLSVCGCFLLKLTPCAIAGSRRMRCSLPGIWTLPRWRCAAMTRTRCFLSALLTSRSARSSVRFLPPPFLACSLAASVPCHARF